MNGKYVGSLGGEQVGDIEGSIPLCLENHTIIGKARIKDNLVEMEIDDETVLKLMDSHLVGQSTFSISAPPNT